MCGRFSQSYTWEAAQAFSLGLTDRRSAAIVSLPRYNIAPNTDVQIIRPSPAGGRELILARWGLIPREWQRRFSSNSSQSLLKKIASSRFNPPLEDVETRPAFRDAFKKQRCIIPASGFYAWTGPKSDRTPHYCTAEDGHILAFAGLWDR
ncbi:SOS response-associated peptidase [Methylocella sp. CPCC 101449]|uniref:SOS response-associated peptidase n=1 Tax=Methylocella sp. CPCC 101449 TaxID=2987531 RepID=UPI0039088856